MSNTNIPEDSLEYLQNQVKAIETLSSIHSLLHEGTFQRRHHAPLELAIAFTTFTHSQMLDAALNHPKALEIKELKKIKEERETKSNG